MNELRHVREDEFVGRFSMRDFVESCDRAFVLYGRGEIANPPREERVEKVVKPRAKREMRGKMILKLAEIRNLELTIFAPQDGRYFNFSQ